MYISWIVQLYKSAITKSFIIQFWHFCDNTLATIIEIYFLSLQILMQQVKLYSIKCFSTALFYIVTHSCLNYIYHETFFNMRICLLWYYISIQNCVIMFKVEALFLCMCFSRTKIKKLKEMCWLDLNKRDSPWLHYKVEDQRWSLIPKDVRANTFFFLFFSGSFYLIFMPSRFKYISGCRAISPKVHWLVNMYRK